MAYDPTTWTTGDTITAEKMNHLEQGIANEQVGPQGPKGETGPAGATGAAAVADVAAAPTMEEFNGLLASLRTAGILAS